jgi:hypothetical protein
LGKKIFWTCGRRCARVRTRYVGVYNPILMIFNALLGRNDVFLVRNGRKMDGFGLFWGELYFV